MHLKSVTKIKIQNLSKFLWGFAKQNGVREIQAIFGVTFFLIQISFLQLFLDKKLSKSQGCK